RPVVGAPEDLGLHDAEVRLEGGLVFKRLVLGPFHVGSAWGSRGLRRHSEASLSSFARLRSRSTVKLFAPSAAIRLASRCIRRLADSASATARFGTGSSAMGRSARVFRSNRYPAGSECRIAPDTIVGR